MKKLLIILLFFGFSYGQEKTLVGVWDCVTCNETYRYILKDNGYGFVTLLNSKGKIQTERIKWETFVTQGNTEVEKGVLTLDLLVISEIINEDYKYFSSSMVNEEMKEILVKIFSDFGKKYNGNDILQLVDKKIFLVKQ
jgi:hypothetical protein